MTKALPVRIPSPSNLPPGLKLAARPSREVSKKSERLPKRRQKNVKGTQDALREAKTGPM